MASAPTPELDKLNDVADTAEWAGRQDSTPSKPTFKPKARRLQGFWAGGEVGNRPFDAAIGVDLAGHEDVLGLWAGTGGRESAKFS